MPRPTETQRPRTAFVAGGSGQLGQAVVARLLADHHRVCVPWVADKEAEHLRERFAGELDRGELRLAQCDVADGDQVAALLDVLHADWGPLWLACSLVGGWAGGTPVEELDDLTVLDRMMLLNVRTATAVAREGLRHMGPEGGRVILVSSRTALIPAAGQAAYSAAKAAVMSLVATLAEELRGSGRTANAIVPKIIDTAANRAAMPDADFDRWVTPEAIAGVIAWLTTVESWPISGAAIPVYGDA